VREYVVVGGGGGGGRVLKYEPILMCQNTSIMTIRRPSKGN